MNTQVLLPQFMFKMFVDLLLRYAGDDGGYEGDGGDGGDEMLAIVADDGLDWIGLIELIELIDGF